PAQYLIGFSFYEEYDLNRWDDTSEPFEDSRAVAYVDWQPEGATKGGVFSYASDRDGVPFLDDTITATDYSWTQRLGARLDAARGCRAPSRAQSLAASDGDGAGPPGGGQAPSLVQGWRDQPTGLIAISSCVMLPRPPTRGK